MSRAYRFDWKYLLRLGESQREYGVELIGPVQVNGSWQHAEGNGFGIGNFQIDWETKKATCPEGKVSSSWIPERDNRGSDVINVVFTKVVGALPL
jgi:transposase